MGRKNFRCESSTGSCIGRRVGYNEQRAKDPPPREAGFFEGLQPIFSTVPAGTSTDRTNYNSPSGSFGSGPGGLFRSTTSRTASQRPGHPDGPGSAISAE